ncbi:outer membrane protein assembly factor BamA [Kaistia dalseonensis]|uniref:Outer membrane protein assembly factor BamA n=2 Tax=Kaistia dalseonensis TaxID=410840 RepID=A0ABU0H1S2_9HYPH|nr:outer membrane protein assembly factor BamA [Kaistia dalseonensis]MDQ0435987.1 outer membrane protein insertion porin family [Kaistia dalseonensis]
MAIAALAFLAQLSILGAVEARAETVSSIVVQGNQRIDAETVRNYVSIQPGKSFGPDQINESIKALYATGLFSDVKIAKRGSSLVVSVSENNVVGSVRFQGNKKLKDDMLTTVVETKPRGVLSQAKLDGDVERLKELYKRNGRAEAAVTVQTIPRDNGRTDVVFNIVEGTRTGISNITFVGNKAFSSRRLRNVMSIKTTNFTSWLSKRDQFDDAKLQADEEQIRRFYMRNGFADFRVVSTDVQFNDQKNRYSITITVDEGARYRFGNVAVDSSITDLNTAPLNSLVQTKSGRVFNSQLVERTTEALNSAVLGEGHSFATVRPRGDRDYANHTINMTYMVDEGPRLYVERIEIRGNTRTRDYVIRREFDMSEGDAYNRVLIDKAERRLKNLGYFKTVNITTQPGSTPDKVVIICNVEDQSTGSFQVGGGYTTDQGGGFIATVSLTEKNFLGRGQYLKLSVGGGQSDRTFNVAFTEPFFLGRRMSLGFDGLYNQAEQTDYRPYNMNNWGGTIRLGLPITDDFDVQFNYKLAQRDVTSWGTQYFQDWGAFAQLYPLGSWINSSVGYQLTYSTIDNYQEPSNGVFVRLAQDFAGIGGDGQFVRSTIDARYYKELMPESDIIGLIKAGAGNITGLGQDVAVLDNFYRGGETIRGFQSFGYGGRYQGVDDSYAIGGTNYYNATLEVQFPMPVFPEEFGLRGAVFADAGTLFGYDGLVGLQIEDSSSIRSSVGASIIWNSPFGPLRADFAQALTKETYDQTQVFRFSAGTQF